MSPITERTSPPTTADEVAPWGPSGARGAWNAEESGLCRLSNLGVHLLRLYAIVDRCGEHNTFVDLGVDHGVSSLALALDAITRHNTVYGVDLSFANLGYDLRSHPCYHRVRGDSVTVGRRWDGGAVDVLVVDTLHVAPQVLCELHQWYAHVPVGGYVVLHDTAWPDGRHDLQWHERARAAGVTWPTPDRAVAAFFGLDEQFARGKHTGFRYADDDVEVDHHADSWGMTIVRRRSDRDLRSNINDWATVFEQRAEVLRTVMTDGARRWFGVDLGPGEP